MVVAGTAERNAGVASGGAGAIAGRDTVVVGIGGARRNALVAAVVGDRLAAVCEQERLTRVRSVGLQPATLPEEALQSVLAAVGPHDHRARTFVTTEPAAIPPPTLPHIRLDHHYAHAATAALTSSCGDAAILICDRHSDPSLSVWSFERGRLIRQPWPSGAGFAAVYSECADLFGFGSGGEYRLEALACLDAGDRFEELAAHVSHRDGVLSVEPGWRSAVSERVSRCGGAANVRASAAVASSFQRCLGESLIALVRDIRAALPHTHLCLGGGLFYNTYFNTRIVNAGVFDRVFVPLNPGNAGAAVGGALAVAQGEHLRATRASACLGPEYTPQDIKSTLDNCKLTYEYLSESDVAESTAAALAKGHVVGWFQGRMEWGHRSLGSRSILANPFCPHVLDNLNVFLKQRERYRAYGVSVCADEAARHFHVPAPSDHMELEYAPLEPDRYHVMPQGARALRVQTIREEARLFADVHRAFGAATGTGVLVNTSFNGFHEPIVCSPRDAVRVFYGSGLDMLVIGRFIVRK